MRKIVHVQVIPQLSGVQQVSLDILNNLGPEYEKYIIFGGEKGSDEFELIFKANNINIIYIKNLHRNISFTDLKAFNDLFRIFKKYRFDIVHTNSTKPGIIARVAARLAGIDKIIHTVHGIAFHKYTPFLKRFFYYFIEIISCAFGDRNVCVNRYYLKYYPKFICKSSAIYNGVDFSQLQKEKKTRSGIVNIAFFARLDAQKSPKTFIEIVDFIVKNNLNKTKAHYYIAGDGELRDDCLKMISKLELKEHISYVGWVSDKSKFLNNIDILCQPSRWEAFGLNIVEAAYFGIPCVASNVEGLPEVVVDGLTGLLFEPENVEGFSNALVKMIDNPQYLEKLSSNAEIHATKKFQLSSMVKSYLEIYKS
jgi:glycosyltransferase involved in cell wall biosynthesis